MSWNKEPQQVPETLGPAVVECEKSMEVGEYILQLTKVYDSSITMEKLVRLQVHTDALYELPTMLALCSSLELIWKNRLIKQSTRQYDIRAELECQVLLLRKSRSKKLREASSILENTLANFCTLR